MSVGILGASGVGKTTLFNALAAGSSITAITGRTKLKVNSVAAQVLHDERVSALVRFYKPRSTVYNTINFHDMDPSECDVSNAVIHPEHFQHLQQMQGFVHVVGCHRGTEKAKEEYSVLENELILHDTAIIEGKINRFNPKKNPPEDLQAWERMLDWLTHDKPLRSLELTPHESKLVVGFTLLSRRPHVTVLNLDDTQEAPKDFPDAIPVRAKLEAELMEMEGEEQAVFMEEYGITEFVVPTLPTICRKKMGLMTFFTTGEDEVKAWPLKPGSTVVDAAGAIHTRLAKNFVKAEVVNWKTLVESGSDWNKVREVVGKDHIAQDGDCILIRATGK